MSWKVHFSDDVEVDFDDLSPDTFAAIAKELDLGLTYWGIYTYPTESPEVIYRVVAAAAAIAEQPIPDKPTTMRQQRALNDMLVRTEEIGDLPVIDGFPPVPGEAESGSTSTSPGNPDVGPPKSPDDNPSGSS